MYSSNTINEDVEHLQDTAYLPQDDFFLFVSNNKSEILEYQNHFRNSFVVDSFAEAKKLISASNLPQLIILDVPLNHLLLTEFKVWLTVNHFNKIPVIYNETALKNDSSKQLFSQGLIDDVVNLQTNFRKLPYKARFIQKLYLGQSLHIINSKTPQEIEEVKSAGDIIRRFLDILISLIALFCLLPLFLIIAIAIKVESRGPVLYNSYRAGKGFKVFRFYKFRTMIPDADKNIDELTQFNIYSTEPKSPHFFKIKDDPRITRLGTFLRNKSLDELPQLFNVLRGDMSIVGNRPLPLYEATTLTTNEWAERFMAPAGITGLWQISKRGQAEMSNEERILLDIDYARNRSLKGDLKILIKTPSALIQKTNV